MTPLRICAGQRRGDLLSRHERHQAMHHNHPYAMRERATRSRRDDQTMSHFRAAVLEDAQRFIEASYRRAIVREAEASAPKATTRSTTTANTSKAIFL